MRKIFKKLKFYVLLIFVFIFGFASINPCWGRYYDPELGRFISVDNYGDNYVYCNNNPINNVDPTGNYVETAFDVAMIGLDIHEFRKNPSAWNAAALVIDVAGAVLPLVPSVAGLTIRGGKAGQAINKSDGVINNWDAMYSSIRKIENRANRIPYYQNMIDKVSNFNMYYVKNKRILYDNIMIDFGRCEWNVNERVKHVFKTKELLRTYYAWGDKASHIKVGEDAMKSYNIFKSTVSHELQHAEDLYRGAPMSWMEFEYRGSLRSLDSYLQTKSPLIHKEIQDISDTFIEIDNYSRHLLHQGYYQVEAKYHNYADKIKNALNFD